MSVPDLIGYIGVICILIAYGALQLEKLSAETTRYSLLSLVGATCIIISLIYDFSAASFVMELCWLVISLFGVWKSLLRKR